MSITILQDKCVSCGRCAEICPEIFKLNQAGKIEILSQEKKDLKCALKASDECPVEAIVVQE